MIEQGTYGLWQENQFEWGMKSVKMLKLLPIHKSGLCQKPLIIGKIRTWTSYSELEPLTEMEWLWDG